MKPVFQTITEIDPSRGIFGNCFQACIASVLELELDEVPHFAQLACEREIARGVPPDEAFKQGTDWWYMLNDWLASRGLYYLEFSEAGKWHEDVTKRLGYHLMIGRSPRGDFDHVVVGRAGEIVHDPREDANGAGLVNVCMFGLFIPVSPAPQAALAPRAADERQSVWPGEWCKRCGRRNVAAWNVISAVWDAVVRGRWNVLCPTCFDEEAEAAGVFYYFDEGSTLLSSADWAAAQLGTHPTLTTIPHEHCDSPACERREPRAER